MPDEPPLRADDPLLAVVAPPHVPRLRELAGIEAGAEVSFDFTGWSKRVVLVGDRALLFPRDHHNVEPLRREIMALEAVGQAGIAEIPELCEVWDDASLSPYPVAAVTRRPGRPLDVLLDEISLDDLARVLEEVAVMAARWHVVDPGPVASASRPGGTHRSAVERMLGRDDADAATVAASIAADLEVPEAQEPIVAALDHARTLDPVLLHGDVHEGQILVDDDLRVTGILDWQSAHVGHPYVEFNFDEWGTRIWRLHRGALRELRRHQWAAYASERGLDARHATAFELVWAIDRALFTTQAEAAGTLRTEISGTVDEARALLLDALSAL